MKDQKHTAEPWHLLDNEISIRAKGESICNMFMMDADKANAKRIVECVNAMAGIKDPEGWIYRPQTEIVCALHHLEFHGNPATAIHILKEALKLFPKKTETE